MTDQPKCPKCQEDVAVLAGRTSQWVRCDACGWEVELTDADLIALALQKAGKPAEQPKSRSQLKRENVMAGRPMDEGVYEPKQPAPLTPEERCVAAALSVVAGIVPTHLHDMGTLLAAHDFGERLCGRADGRVIFVPNARGQSLIDRLNAEEAKRG